MAHEALRQFPGDRLIYIGETEGDCCAGDAFFGRLARGWQVVTEHRPVQWWGIHDWITVYQR